MQNLDWMLDDWKLTNSRLELVDGLHASSSLVEVPDHDLQFVVLIAVLSDNFLVDARASWNGDICI